ncbi:MAG TPA: branched-chain amino acid ABC transporter substrate-binding protein [Candidatus Acidoferrum sp.]|nr:branched-chain amino acid ABC transporter substrate-binding protein [Candidatus Acidoferrum sp.]
MATRIILIGLLLLGLLAGCSGDGDKVIKIALAVPLTGDDAAHGQGMKRAFEMAVEDANASGKLKGMKLEGAEFDDRSDPKEAVTVANQIISDRKIMGVIGHLNSGCSIPASQVYAKRNLVMITPASTNPKLTQQGLKTVFRVCGTDDVQGSFGANYVFDTLKLNRVAVIHDKTAYGQGLAEEFQKQFEKIGGTVTSFNGIDRGEKDYKALLTRIKTESPLLIYYGGLYAEAGLISKQSKELGLNVPLMGGDGILTNEFARIAGKASEGDMASMVGLPPQKLPKAKDFLTRYQARFPGYDVEPYDPLTYEAASLLVEALVAVNFDQTKLVDYISKMDYNGILGETSFDERGDNRNKLISMNRVTDGKFEFYEHK